MKPSKTMVGFHVCKMENAPEAFAEAERIRDLLAAQVTQNVVELAGNSAFSKCR